MSVYSLVHLILCLQRPQDILQLLLDAEATNAAAGATASETQQMNEQQSAHQLDKIVNFGAKKLSIEVR